MMGDFLTNVIARNLEVVDRLVPRGVSRFEPLTVQQELAAPSYAPTRNHPERIEEHVLLDAPFAREVQDVTGRGVPSPPGRLESPADAAAATHPLSADRYIPEAEPIPDAVRAAPARSAPIRVDAEPLVSESSDAAPVALREHAHPSTPVTTTGQSTDRRVHPSTSGKRTNEPRHGSPGGRDTITPQPPVESGRVETAAISSGNLPGFRTATQRPDGREAPDEQPAHPARQEATGLDISQPGTPLVNNDRTVVPVQPSVSASSEAVRVEFELSNRASSHPRDAVRDSRFAATERRERSRAQQPPRHEGGREMPDTFEPQSEPSTVHITIGRIEVKAAPNTPPNKPRPSTPAASNRLEEYLRRRAQGHGQ